MISSVGTKSFVQMLCKVLPRAASCSGRHVTRITSSKIVSHSSANNDQKNTNDIRAKFCSTLSTTTHANQACLLALQLSSKAQQQQSQGRRHLHLYHEYYARVCLYHTISSSAMISRSVVPSRLNGSSQIRPCHHRGQQPMSTKSETPFISSDPTQPSTNLQFSVSGRTNSNQSGPNQYNPAEGLGATLIYEIDGMGMEMGSYLSLLCLPQSDLGMSDLRHLNPSGPTSSCTNKICFNGYLELNETLGPCSQCRDLFNLLIFIIL